MAGKEVNFGVKVGVGVQGAESLTGLANRLDDISKVLDDDLAGAARAAATRLRELGEQDQAITDFQKLRTEATNAARALKSAETEASAYGKQIAAAGPPTAAEAANMARLQAAVTAAKTAVDQQGQSLATAQATLQRYGISGDQAGAAQKRLRTEAAAVAASVKDIAPAYDGAAQGAQSAGAAMTRTHRAIGEGVSSISEQLGRMQALYAGLAGLQGAKALAKDLADTADEAKNLQARMGLVVGEAAATGEAWDAVTQVALRTYSALEGTGTLFTKIAQQGRDAGLSVAQAQERSLALTETINQAIQLSGASAQASDAALVQLIQGLNGGVLRGEEFNSVMEQAPRLARALADGLGVTTGELRKMAEAGALTSDTVIKALQGQSQVIESEFGKLPVTVGRALQNLSTQWTLYIAEADKGSQASAAAAKAINAMAENLGAIAGLLIDAGQAAAAFAALRLAQTFLGIGTAAGTAAAQIGVANTQLRATEAAAAGAAAGAGRFAALLAGLRTFTIVGLVANFKDIGTWIGEATARLVGYRDRSEEIARLEKQQAEAAKEAAADRARLAAAIQAQIDKQFELSKAASAAVAEFAALTKEGTSAAEAVKKITDGFDMSKVQGVRDFSAVVDKLASDGKLSAAEFQAAWAQALSGQDLARFEILARTAFTGAARETDRLAQAMDAVLREAVNRTGLDFDNLRGRIGAASRSAINDVDAIANGLVRLKAQGVDTGQALSASLTRAISTADTQTAIDAVRTRIESLRKTLGDTITNGLLDQAAAKARELQQAVEDATPGINSVAEAMRALGITSDATLKQTAATAKQAYDALTASGTASARELGAGFKAAADAAIAANNGIAPVWVTAQAAVRGYALETDSAGKSTLRVAGDASKGIEGLAKSWDNAGAAAASAGDKAVAALERQNAAQERANAALEKAAELERKRQGVDKEGFTTDKSGNRLVAGSDLGTMTGIAAFLKAAGISNEDTARSIAREFADNRGNVIYMNNPGQLKYGGKGSTISEALLKAAERYTFGSNSQPAQTPSTIPEPGKTITVNVNRTGQPSERIVVADQNSADALLRLLGDGATRS